MDGWEGNIKNKKVNFLVLGVEKAEVDVRMIVVRARDVGCELEMASFGEKTYRMNRG